MAYDRADWHYGGNFRDDLPDEAGGTHIGMFLAWAILRGLEGKNLHEFPDELLAVRGRQMTGRDFLMRVCDGKFWQDDLDREGQAFAQTYYQNEKKPNYYQDYEAVLGGDLPSLYHV